MSYSISSILIFFACLITIIFTINMIFSLIDKVNKQIPKIIEDIKQAKEECNNLRREIRQIDRLLYSQIKWEPIEPDNISYDSIKKKVFNIESILNNLIESIHRRYY